MHAFVRLSIHLSTHTDRVWNDGRIWKCISASLSLLYCNVDNYCHFLIGYPFDKAARIALKTVRHWLEELKSENKVSTRFILFLPYRNTHLFTSIRMFSSSLPDHEICRADSARISVTAIWDGLLLAVWLSFDLILSYAFPFADLNECNRLPKPSAVQLPFPFSRNASKLAISHRVSNIYIRISLWRRTFHHLPTEYISAEWGSRWDGGWFQGS